MLRVYISIGLVWVNFWDDEIKEDTQSGHVANIADKRNAYRILDRKPKGKQD
jgi:hypothetical protein